MTTHMFRSILKPGFDQLGPLRGSITILSVSGERLQKSYICTGKYRAGRHDLTPDDRNMCCQ